MQRADRRQHRIAAAICTCGPGALWVGLFLIVPFIAIFVISFLTRGEYGEIQLPWTLANYSRFIGFGAFGYDAVYALIFARSLLLALVTSALCIVLGVPLAFFIAGLTGRKKQLALTLVIIPFWINLLIRTYAWQIILAPDSILSNLAVALGLLEAGDGLYPSTFAVYLGTLSDYLPYFVLPLYASVEKVDWHLAEAAMDLGANRAKVFVHALLPQIFPGLSAGTILVFVPAMGQFVVPDLLGGAKTALLGNAIGQQFGPSRDWPFGAAISVVAMVFVMVGLWIYTKRGQQDGQELI